MLAVEELILAMTPATRIALMVVAIIAGVVVLTAALIYMKFNRLWLQAKLSNADVMFGELVGMYLRKVDVHTIVLSRITAVQAGIELTTRDMESHCLAGGDVARAVRAMIVADRAGMDMSWADVTAIDLAGRDVLAEVQEAAKPAGPDDSAATVDPDTLKRLVGQVGTASEPLCAGGMCEFLGSGIECVVDSVYAEAGQKVEIVDIQDGRPIVRVMEES